MTTRDSLGIRVNKVDAAQTISDLRGYDLLDSNLRIRQEMDLVLIPILGGKGEVQNLVSSEIEVVDTWFEEKEKVPQSLKTAFLELVPTVDATQVPTSFDQIGDIAVIDLKEPMIPHQKEIAEAIMLANPSIVAVFRKSSKVSGLYRLRGLEHIGGLNRTRTVHKEHGLQIHIDIETTYFSPRLATEHAKIAQKVKDGESVLDLFGGLAPFALHIAKNTSARILTVDHNPSTTELIQSSLKSNSLKGEIQIATSDAGKMVEELIAEQRTFNHIILNHPSGAVDYLSLASSLLSSEGRIYLYVFAPLEELESYCKSLISKIAPQLQIADIRTVRQSSPSEYHTCIELRN